MLLDGRTVLVTGGGRGIGAAICRVLARHGWIDYTAGYDEIKDYFESALPSDAPLFNEFHALLVRVGKEFCRRAAPKCETCPLRELLPSGGIVEAI